MARVEEFLSAQREDSVVCMICLEAIPFDAAIWSCQRSCHMPFHLLCVQVSLAACWSWISLHQSQHSS